MQLSIGASRPRSYFPHSFEKGPISLSHKPFFFRLGFSTPATHNHQSMSRIDCRYVARSRSILITQQDFSAEGRHPPLSSTEVKADGPWNDRSWTTRASSRGGAGLIQPRHLAGMNECSQCAASNSSSDRRGVRWLLHHHPLPSTSNLGKGGRVLHRTAVGRWRWCLHLRRWVD